MVIVHVLLLLIDGADRAQTLRLARGQIFSEGQFAIDGIQVTPEVSQLLPNGFAGHFRGVFTASCVFQVIFPGAFAVGSRLLSVRGIVKNVQKRFGVLPGLVEQGNILRITDIGRRAGGVHDHSAAVSASSRLAVRIIIVILGFGFFDLTLLCVPHDHLIDLTQHFRRQALAPVWVAFGSMFQHAALRKNAQQVMAERYSLEYGKTAFTLRVDIYANLGVLKT